MAVNEILSKLIKEVQEESSPVVQLSNQLIEDYCKDLDSAISELDIIMDSIGENSIGILWKWIIISLPVLGALISLNYRRVRYEK